MSEHRYSYKLLKKNTVEASGGSKHLDKQTTLIPRSELHNSPGSEEFQNYFPSGLVHLEHNANVTGKKNAPRVLIL